MITCVITFVISCVITFVITSVITFVIPSVIIFVITSVITFVITSVLIFFQPISFASQDSTAFPEPELGLRLRGGLKRKK